MIRVLLIEFRRFAWRRSFRFFGILALAGIALAATIVFFTSHEPEGDLQAEHEAAIADCVRSFENFDEPPPPGYRTVEEFCREAAIPIEALDPRFRLTSLTDVFQGTSIPLIILGLALGASFIGAEWHAGTMTTLLTWEPRRARVLIGKLVAVMAAVAISAVVLQAILGLALWPVAALRGTTVGADLDWLKDTAAVVGRGAAIAGLASVLGFAIAAVARNTTTALVIGFVYFAVVEGLVRGLKPKWQPWLIGDNAAAFITADPQGVFSSTEAHSVVGSLVVVIAYAAGAAALATAWFQARDVT